MKRFIFISVLALFLIAPGMSFSEDAPVPGTQLTEGNVAQVDSVASFLTLNSNNQEIVFAVEPDAKIQRGTEEISLDDIEPSDSVMVEYLPYPDGSLHAIGITDNNIANDF